MAQKTLGHRLPPLSALPERFAASLAGKARGQVAPSVDGASSEMTRRLSPVGFAHPALRPDERCVSPFA